MPGVARLRAARGREEVSFDDVADHLVDYAHRHAEHRAALDGLASFLADVEHTDHDHDVAAGSSGA
jgi:hypothetical protein